MMAHSMTTGGSDQLNATGDTRPTWLDRAIGFRAMRHSKQDLCFESPIDIATVMDALEAKYRTALATNAPAVAVAQPAVSDGLTLRKSEVVELAVQTWRLGRRVDALDAEKNPREKKQFSESLARFKKFLELLKLECVDPVGQIYTDGWAEVEVVSWEAPEEGVSASEQKVKQTIAPIVRRSGEIIARGQVVVTGT